MYAIKRCSESSADADAKYAICGLKAHTRSAVASTIDVQNSNIASPWLRRRAGNRVGSGSSPTHSSEFTALQRAFSMSTNFIGFLRRLAHGGGLRRADFTDHEWSSDLKGPSLKRWIQFRNLVLPCRSVRRFTEQFDAFRRRR